MEGPGQYPQGDSVGGMAIDVTDETFETEVIERSKTTPVLIDFWAEWCGPCRTLGPILEKVCDATNGQVVLAKVDVDKNPALSQALQIQGIPAVFIAQGGQLFQGFTGAYPEHIIQELVDSLMAPAPEDPIAELIAAGDEDSLRKVLEVEPGNAAAICALADLLVQNGSSEEALQLLARIPEDDHTIRIAAAARLAQKPADNYEQELDALLDLVKADEEARQKFIDILAVMGPEDPRTARYRKLLTGRLY